MASTTPIKINSPKEEITFSLINTLSIPYNKATSLNFQDIFKVNNSTNFAYTFTNKILYISNPAYNKLYSISVDTSIVATIQTYITISVKHLKTTRIIKLYVQSGQNAFIIVPLNFISTINFGVVNASSTASLSLSNLNITIARV